MLIKVFETFYTYNLLHLTQTLTLSLYVRNGFGENKVFVWFSKYKIGSDNETSFHVLLWIHEILHIEADIYYAQHSICMHNNEAQLYPANNIVLYFSTTEIS